MEIALDHANKTNAEASKTIKRYLQQLKVCNFYINIDFDRVRKFHYFFRTIRRRPNPSSRKNNVPVTRQGKHTELQNDEQTPSPTSLTSHEPFSNKPTERDDVPNRNCTMLEIKSTNLATKPQSWVESSVNWTLSCRRCMYANRAQN